MNTVSHNSPGRGRRDYPNKTFLHSKMKMGKYNRIDKSLFINGKSDYHFRITLLAREYIIVDD